MGVQEAAAKDVSLADAPAAKDKNEVVLPIGLPDEGTFDWLDMWHAKNPGFTEISARTLLAWAEKSGLWRKGGFSTLNPRDKPSMNFDISSLDDGSIDRMIKTFAPLQKRDYVIMEVRGNLIKEEREAMLARFPSSSFRKVATVQLGEPNMEFKQRVQENTLKAKQAASDVEHNRKIQQEKAKKIAEKK